MNCRNCDFHQSGCLWNRCNLMEAEYYREYNETPCPMIDDNYVFTEDCELLGFVKGESAIEFMKGGVG